MKPLLFHTTDYKYLAEKVFSAGDFEMGEVEVDTFSDGERYQRIASEVNGRNVVLIGGTTTDAATLELYDLASSLVSYGANALHLVIPYFGYSTMERAVKTGEIVTAKTRARLFSSVPRSSKGNHIYLFDLHTEGIPHYFENSLHCKHVYCKDIVMKVAKQYGGDDFVLASTDAGRAKWVESLANDMGVNAAFVLKRRVSGDSTEVTAVNADVKDKVVVIYDDMIRSGGSIVNAARTYKEAGASEIYVITTHGIFVSNGLEKLRDCGLIKKVICTDTHSNTQQFKDPFLEVRSVGDLIAQAVS
ncbi:MAG: ribose-phosphate diphosphokinase [bacterium]|nr:ribose-phosphate diphosphokinase [bacterium]